MTQQESTDTISCQHIISVTNEICDEMNAQNANITARLRAQNASIIELSSSSHALAHIPLCVRELGCEIAKESNTPDVLKTVLFRFIKDYVERPFNNREEVPIQSKSERNAAAQALLKKLDLFAQYGQFCASVRDNKIIRS